MAVASGIGFSERPPRHGCPTYTLEQSYALLQNAALFDAGASAAPTAAASACYDDIPLAAGQRDMGGLAAGRHPSLENFRHIEVEDVPLAGG